MTVAHCKCLSRRSLRGVLVVVAVLVSASVLSGQTVSWRCSEPGNYWQDRGTLTFGSNGNSSSTIQIDPTTQYQQIDGFGGAFNEIGWESILTLDPCDQQAVMEALFGNSGCRFTLCRVPIGASDFAIQKTPGDKDSAWYSHNMTAGDYDMSEFSIARDHELLIPFIEEAMTYQPSMKIFASPWSTPEWMKTSGRYCYGQLNWNSQTLSAYAHYLSLFVQAYQALGIDVYAVHPQNEMSVNPGVCGLHDFPHCEFTPAQMREFIRDYLGPRFDTDNVDAEIWLGTLCHNDAYSTYTNPILSDSTVRNLVTGVGYQYGGRDSYSATRSNYPEKKIFMTEQMCGDGTNTWDYAEELVFGLMNGDFRQGRINGYFAWNMVLDETGSSSWGWVQNAMITVDTATAEVTWNPQFYAVNHFAHYIDPGAYCLGFSGNHYDCSMFLNADSEVVVEVLNINSNPIDLTLIYDGQTIRPTIPGDSFNTFTFYTTPPTPPCMPESLQVTDETETTITLDWDASTDGLAAGYYVYRDAGTTPIATTAATSYTDGGLTHATVYSYQVSAYNGGGESAQTAPVVGTTLPDQQDPDMNDDGVVDESDLTTFAGHWLDTGLPGAPTGDFDTDGVVALGDLALMSAQWKLPDVTPPTTPTGFQADTITQTSIALSWQSADDDRGVTGYSLYRNGGTSPIGTTAGTAYTDDGLIEDTAYTYTLDAFDAGGNHSPETAPLVVTTDSSVSNYLLNPSFEQATGGVPDYWTDRTSSDWDQTTAHDGAASLKVSVDTGDIFISQNNITLPQASVEYKITGWMKTTADATGDGLFIRYANLGSGSGDWGTWNNRVVAQTDWQYREIPFTPQDVTGRFDCHYGSLNTGQGWFDDLTIEQSP